MWKENTFENCEEKAHALHWTCLQERRSQEGGSNEDKFMARDIRVDKGSHILKIWKERNKMEIIQNV